MAKKGGENSKKAAGNARKADAAADKAAAQRQKEEAAEAAKWDKGSKDTSKAEKEAQKAAEKARKKAELAALEAEEEKNTPGRAQPKNSKTAVKKTAQPAPSRGTLDLAQLDEPAGGTATQAAPVISASGIDNALDALSLAQGSTAEDASKIDRHPERRFKAAYAVFEERRLREMAEDGSGAGLRLNQRKERIRKEFEKSPENPFNQVSAAFNATQEEMRDAAQGVREDLEKRLASPQ